MSPTPSVDESIADARRAIAVLRASHERLSVIVGPLPVEMLSAPSYTAEWTIAQVLSHLGSQAEIYDEVLDRVVAGEESESSSHQPIWDLWDARSPEAQARDSLAFNQRLVDRFETLTDPQLAELRLQRFGMELDATRFIDLRLSEHAIHTWDVAVVLDPQALIALDAVMRLVPLLPISAARLGKPNGRAIHLHVRTHAPEHDFALLIDEEVQLVAWNDQDVQGTLDLPAEALLRLIWGRLDGDHAPGVVLDAADLTLDELSRIFPGF